MGTRLSKRQQAKRLLLWCKEYCNLVLLLIPCYWDDKHVLVVALVLCLCVNINIYLDLSAMCKQSINHILFTERQA